MVKTIKKLKDSGKINEKEELELTLIENLIREIKKLRLSK